MKQKSFGSIGLNLFSVAAVTLLLLSVSIVQADYPIMSQHYAADPTAVEWNGRIYVYCSNDEENADDGSGGYIMDAIACFSTDDLKNWTDHGVVLPTREISWSGGEADASEVVYHDGKFY